MPPTWWGKACFKIHDGLALATISFPPFSLSLHQDFRASVLKIQEQPFDLFFVSWLIYKICMPFQFHPSWKKSSLNLVQILFIVIFFVLNHFLNWFCFTISLSFDFFFLSNLILILLIANFFALTIFLNWYF